MRGLWAKVARSVHWPTRQGRRWVAIGIAALVVLLVLGTFLSRGLGILRLRHDLVRLDKATVEAAAEQKRLRAELASASTAKVLEDKAREELGLIKPGEEKVIFVEE
ncbi:MAG: septum formation initiator family protein [Thermotogota bacterium]